MNLKKTIFRAGISHSFDVIKLVGEYKLQEKGRESGPSIFQPLVEDSNNCNVEILKMVLYQDAFKQLFDHFARAKDVAMDALSSMKVDGRRSMKLIELTECVRSAVQKYSGEAWLQKLVKHHCILGDYTIFKMLAISTDPVSSADHFSGEVVFEPEAEVTGGIAEARSEEYENVDVAGEASPTAAAPAPAPALSVEAAVPDADFVFGGAQMGV